MSWNNRVVVAPYTHKDGTVEYTATIREVYYGDKVGSTGDINAVGSGFNEADAVLELKLSLELMLEAVNFVLSNKTPIYNENDVSTHIPGESSLVLRRREVLDQDDAYMDENYGEED